MLLVVGEVVLEVEGVTGGGIFLPSVPGGLGFQFFMGAGTW